MKEILTAAIAIIFICAGILCAILIPPNMSVSDIVNIGCAGAALIFTIVIGATQIHQSRKMKEFEKRIDDRDEKRHNDQMNAQAVAFISKYYSERGLIPLCAIAAMHDDQFGYSREMYGEFCCYPIEIQNNILEHAKLDLRVIRDDKFFYKCLDSLIKARNKYLPEDKNIFYGGGKYIYRSLDYFGSEKIPDSTFEYESRLTDVLSEPFRNKDTKAKPIEQLADECDFYNSPEINACQFATTVAKFITIYGRDTDDCGKEYGSPGGYDGERIETMEDLFLKTMFHIYTELVLTEN